jgi:hypothetical protein
MIANQNERDPRLYVNAPGDHLLAFKKSSSTDSVAVATLSMAPVAFTRLTFGGLRRAASFALSSSKAVISFTVAAPIASTVAASIRAVGQRFTSTDCNADSTWPTVSSSRDSICTSSWICLSFFAITGFYGNPMYPNEAKSSIP